MRLGAEEPAAGAGRATLAGPRKVAVEINGGGRKDLWYGKGNGGVAFFIRFCTDPAVLPLVFQHTDSRSTSS